MDKKHGITIREKDSGLLMKFIECDTGKRALTILSGVRINLNHDDYKASEEYVEQEEIDGIKVVEMI